MPSSFNDTVLGVTVYPFNHVVYALMLCIAGVCRQELSDF